MANAESYVGKTFVVADPDARLRDPDDLSVFLRGADGEPAVIPLGTRVSARQVRIRPRGAKKADLFALAFAANGGGELGWTSTRNFAGGFLSETIGSIPPPPGSHQKGGHAAWSNGKFLKQLTLVKVVGSDDEIEHIAEETCDEFLAMAAAAQAAGIVLKINSGFRSFPEQKHLHDGFTRKLPGFFPANRPGFSNHQNGIAFDIPVGSEATATYKWLKANATGFGFVRTVRKEAWHWEFLPAKAAQAKARGVCSTFD